MKTYSKRNSTSKVSNDIPRLSDLLANSLAAEPFFSEYPSVVGIEITGRCALQCRHCFNESGPNNQQELPLTLIEKMLDEIQSWSVKEIRLSGGEPTYHHHFREIVTACKQRNIAIVLNTNGFYSASLLNFLKSAWVKLFIISIDGLQASNDWIRGQGVFLKIMDACTELINANQTIMLAFHVGKNNLQDLPGVAAIAADFGINFKVSPIRPIGRAAFSMPNALLNSSENKFVVETVSDLRQQYPHIKIFTDFDVIDNTFHYSCGKDHGRASCKAGRTMININYDGEIYPCAFFATQQKEFSAGNVRNISLTEAWQDSPKFIPFRVQQKSSACQQCQFYENQCAGGCPAISYAVTGYLDKLDPTCFVAKDNN